MLDDLINRILTEYGTFFSLLLVAIGGLVYAIKHLWKVNVALDTRLDVLSNKFLEALENNTKVITQLVERLDRHPHD